MKRTVCILGMSPSTRDLIVHEPDDGREWWSLNQAHNYYGSEVRRRFTRWFQVHPWEAMEERQTEPNGHLEWLKTCDIPVYLEELNPEMCPTGVKYPYPEVCEMIGGAYLTSALAFMLALAIYLDFEEIRIYGVDMGSSTEYDDQRPCFEFLIGQAVARGITVWLPPGCPLLKGPLYAKTVYITTSTIEKLMRMYMHQRDDLLARYNELTGKIEEVKDSLRTPQGIEERVAEVELAREEIKARFNMTSGMVNAMDDALRMALKGGIEPGEYMPGNLLLQDEYGLVVLKEASVTWTVDHLLLGGTGVTPDPTAPSFTNIRDIIPRHADRVGELLVG